MEHTTYRKIEVSIVRETQPIAPPIITCSDDLVEFLKSLVGNQTREHFIAVYLDIRNQVLGVHTVSIGHSSGAVVHPREVFTPAVHLSASGVIVAHNHPSGDPSPSLEDQEVTDRLRHCGELLGIELLDHIIIGSHTHYSFAAGIGI